MAMQGLIVMESQTLMYRVRYTEGGANLVNYTIADNLTGIEETREVGAEAFMAALGIALHWDGDPNAERDYQAAESIQPANPELRWIP